MGEYLRKAFAFVFWRLRVIFGAPHGDSGDWKVLGIMASVALGLLLTVLFRASVMLQCRLLSDISYWALIAPMAIALLLGYPAPAHLQAVLGPFQAEFEKYSRTKRVLGTGVVFVGIIGVALLVLQAASVASRLPDVSCF